MQGRDQNIRSFEETSFHNQKVADGIKMRCCKYCKKNNTINKSAERENVFQRVPMAVFKGYKKAGTIYPKGWKYNGTILEQDVFVKTDG